ncbi:hypothetical protein NLX83_36660 [Allokutzneria sp. A3M-2-11 16]|uniref:hypothetical protein n=1 Tax=Allokutzneria sp. A3M-2-11 16 TaxID=2962043 RepID=UPI0020B8FE69|nr:hypothetical protein [Allokutzneria sp. A3M-2-11 16]MCP3804813.1 hypothetical protein [Allokutzneria sp. A3M-2-11 16]
MNTVVVALLALAPVAPTQLERPADISADASVEPVAVNDSGLIAGYSYSPTTLSRAVLWGRDGKPRLLPTLSDRGIGRAEAINASGTVVGLSLTPDHKSGVAVRWDRSGAVKALDGKDTRATAINEHGTVIGTMSDGRGNSRPVRWSNEGQRSDLQVLPGDTGSRPAAINDSGVAVGVSDRIGGEWKAVRWDPSGAVTALATHPGKDRYSTANAINRDGTIVGSAWRLDGTVGAVKWSRAGEISDIPAPAGFIPDANDIDDSGRVLGSIEDEGGRRTATAWTPAGVITTLNGLGDHSYPYSLSNTGVAVGTSGSLPVRWTLPR